MTGRHPLRLNLTAVQQPDFKVRRPNDEERMGALRLQSSSGVKLWVVPVLVARHPEATKQSQ